METNFKKHIAIPQDHGAWIFILSPLLIGFFAGGRFNFAALTLFIATMATFMLRQPMAILVKVKSGRRPETDRGPAHFWTFIYGGIAILALVALIIEGFGYVLFLAIIPGAPVFAWHLWLVSRRAERKRVNIEIIATGVLSLAAPAAYWVSFGGYNSLGWWLWALSWAQTAASIVYAYLRLAQRELTSVPQKSEQWKLGRDALLYTSFNLCATLMLGWANIVPQLIFVPFLLQWFETLWGITHPAIGWKPTQIGIRQLIVSVVWMILFILCWRL